MTRTDYLASNVATTAAPRGPAWKTAQDRVLLTLTRFRELADSTVWFQREDYSFEVNLVSSVD